MCVLLQAEDQDPTGRFMYPGGLLEPLCGSSVLSGGSVVRWDMWSAKKRTQRQKNGYVVGGICYKKRTQRRHYRQYIAHFMRRLCPLFSRLLRELLANAPHEPDAGVLARHRTFLVLRPTLSVSLCFLGHAVGSGFAQICRRRLVQIGA